MVLTVPLLLILSWYWGITGIYYSLPLADILTGCVCVLLLRTQLIQMRMQWQQV
ncbi:hypothetical protein RBA69_21810 [Brenneria goodwinii]